MTLVDFQGTTDCSGNPNYPGAVNGDVYAVSVAGRIGGGSGSIVEAGDMAVCVADNIGGTQAAVGASWRRLQVNVTVPVVGPTAATTAGAFASFTGTDGKNIYQAYTAETSELTDDGTTIPTSSVVYAAINSLRAELT